MNAPATNKPVLRVDSDACPPSSRGVSVCNLGSDLVLSLGRGTRTRDLLKSIFRVTVIQAGSLEGDGLPGVFGRYQVLEDEVRFIPHFPFERGVKYRASFDPRPLGGPQPSEVLTLEFLLPRERNAVATEVKCIFPSGDSLPENLLRFYVCFSNSMQRGRIEEQIALLASDGSPVPDVLYRAPVELWDRSMQYLTILLDPGRLKRWVGPNVELGPPLKAGQEYTLAIGSGMMDLSGRPLRESFYKRFRVAEAVREQVAVQQWKIVRPLTGTRQPLVLLFPRPLDWALLLQTITIEMTGGLAIEGRTVIDHCETRWSFIPKLPWAAGAYHIRVASTLEDVCGNSVVAAFDRPLRSGSDLAREATNRSLLFHLV